MSAKANSDVLVRVEEVSKKFCRGLRRSLWYGVQDIAADLVGRDSAARELRSDEFWAVDDVSFELRRGECLGLIGRNGAGKTTLLKMLNGLIKPDRGRIEMRGRIGALIALGAGFNPILTGRENIYTNGSILGLTRQEIRAKLDEIIGFAGLEEFIDSPVQSYSSGMIVRLGFSVASFVHPDVLLVDEVLAVGDAEFRIKAQKSIRQALGRGTGVILVSHNLHDIGGNASRCIWLDHGKARMNGSTRLVCSKYLLEQSVAQRQQGPAFQYSLNRCGHAVLSSVTVNPSRASDGTLVIDALPMTAQIDLQFEAVNDIEDKIAHAFNLTSQHGYVGRAAVSDSLTVKKGNQFIRRFSFEIPDLLPGRYRIEYFAWVQGGDMLEGVLNLLDIEVPPSVALSRLEALKPAYFLEKMTDNSRGGIPLSVAVQTDL